ncbi:uncharacterized protein LOC124266846 [Haliotis rubra]|uniref:uncharacterized protein LOC124266846 n=1 Tax=Haliotis rubra TaxID=36100 RepID=UPI001EE5A577|nr:uncharacterized protein LOC124266846 [Haliotis rubra]
MATTPSAQAPVMLTCVLMLLTCIQISQQQVNFYNSCQDASAEGTLRVSINEVDNQATIDASPNEYRAGLGLAGNTQSIGLQFDANTNAQLPPAEYFALESGPRSGSVTGREWFLRLKKPIDRDGGRPDSLDDSTVFEYYLQCTDLTINTPGDPNVAASILARDQDTLNTPIIFSVVLSEPRGYENSFKLRVSTWQVQASTG